MAALQHTVRQPARFAGVGVHTGAYCKLSVLPASADAGVVFVRTDVSDRNPRIPATPEAVRGTELGTVIGNADGVTVSTIEHLMAAFAMLGVDNAVVELDGPEVPILDGSAAPFVRGLDRAGLRAQEALRRFIEILDVIEVLEGEKRATLKPAMGFETAFEIEFASAAIGRQSVDLSMDEAAFRRELADCRTFGFLADVEHLRAKGLARGGSMDNCVVIDGDVVLNPEGLRRPDEFVRHKALDAIGDLYVLGAPILGRFEGVRAGHAINIALVRSLAPRPDAWRVRTLAEDLKQAV